MQTQAIIRHIVQWLKDYAEQARAKGFVVGVSGGIDSAVVSTLAAQTGLSVLLLEMPIRQKSDQVNRAQEHMGRLKQRYPNVKAQSVDLTPAFDTFADTVDVSETEFPNKQLALANARSRLRMTTLYYYGQLHGLLVAGTGNKIGRFRRRFLHQIRRRRRGHQSDCRFDQDSSVRAGSRVGRIGRHSKSRADRRPLGYRAYR